MVFDAHTHSVDKYREENSALKVTMVDNYFEVPPE